LAPIHQRLNHGRVSKNLTVDRIQERACRLIPLLGHALLLVARFLDE